MADTNTFRASAVGLIVAGAKPSQAHQRYIAGAASLPDGGIKNGDYGKRAGNRRSVMASAALR